LEYIDNMELESEKDIKNALKKVHELFYQDEHWYCKEILDALGNVQDKRLKDLITSEIKKSKELAEL